MILEETFSTFPRRHNNDLFRYSRFAVNVLMLFLCIPFILTALSTTVITRGRFTQGNCKEKFWVIYTNRLLLCLLYMDRIQICCLSVILSRIHHTIINVIIKKNKVKEQQQQQNTNGKKIRE